MGATPTLSVADLFAFDGHAPDAGGAWAIVNVTPIAPISPEEALSLVARVRWPAGCPLGPAIEAALPPAMASHENSGAHTQVSGAWHAIPHQGIDGQIDDFHLLVGTMEFIEDAGITIGPEVVDLLARHEDRGWTSVLIGACHTNTDAHSPRRSLLAVLAVALIPTNDVPTSPASRRDTIARPRATRRGFGSWRTLSVGIALAALSACVGLWLSAFRVAVSQIAVVQRFGRVVATLEPGLHIRPLWPFEHITRLDPHAIRTLTLGLPQLQAATAPPLSELLLTGDTWKGIPADDAHTTSAVPQPQLIAATVRVQYKIADPVKYLFAAESPDHLLAAAAESVLCGLLSGRSMQESIGPQRGTLTTLLQQSLQQRAEAYNCGLAIHNVVIDTLQPADLFGDAVRSEAEADERERIRRDTLLIQARNQADRIVQEAQTQVTDLLAQAQIDQESSAQIAMNVLEWVRAYAPAFRRDPQHTRQQILQALHNPATAPSPSVPRQPAISAPQRSSTHPAGEVNP